MKIYIDVGHGGKDPGAVADPYIEHELNKVVAQSLAKRLTEHGHLVKTEVGNLTVQQSAEASTVWGADLLISVHHNAGHGDRGEVIYSIDPDSKIFAGAIADGLKRAGQEVVKVYGRTNVTNQLDYYGILRYSKCPACIVEPCFIDNLTDRHLIDTLIKQKQVGECIAEGIADKYGRWEDIGTDITVVVKGKEVKGKLVAGATWVPLRETVTAMTPVIIWDAKTQTVEVK